MADIYIFGTGHLYEENKSRIRKDINVLGFIDNDVEKQGAVLDGKRIYSPEVLTDTKYDFVFLMCFYPSEMREQLMGLGIDDGKIFDINRSGVLLEQNSIQIYGKLKRKNKFVVFSHSLTSTGAQNMMLNALKIIKEFGYKIIVVSRESGILRDVLLDEDISVVIAEDIFSNEEVLSEVLDGAERILVNTLWLYYVSDVLGNSDIKVLWWLHELSDTKYVSRRVFRRIAGHRNVTILSVSNYIDENIKSLYGDDVLLKRLLWGIKEYTCPAKEFGHHEGKIILACIGGISSIKGQDIFIDAICGLPENIKGRIRCQIIGSGQFDDKYSQIIRETDCIEVLGEIENSRMSKVYGTIDAVVCCSRVESMSVVVAEACMNGKISIVSSGAGISELLTDKVNAFIFENENVVELRGIIDWLVNNFIQAQEIGVNSREVYDAYFSMSAFEREIRSYLDL